MTECSLCVSSEPSARHKVGSKGEVGTGCFSDLGERYPPLFVWVNTEAPCKFISITAKLSCTYLFASHWVCQSMSSSNEQWEDTSCSLLCGSPYFWHSILVPKPARSICTSAPRVIRSTVLLPRSRYCSPAKQSNALKMVPALPMHQSGKVRLGKTRDYVFGWYQRRLTFFYN